MPAAGRLAMRWIGVGLLALAAACARGDAVPGVGDPFTPHAFMRLDAPGSITVPGPGLIVLNVWATWCGPCRREMASLERLHGRLAAHGVRVIGISVDEDLNLAREFVRREGLTFPNGVESAHALAAGAAHVTRFPTTFVIDRAGIVRWREERARDWSDDETAARLGALLASAGPM
jgi:thiol-disulfide isomerase/thioredoxin